MNILAVFKHMALTIHPVGNAVRLKLHEIRLSEFAGFQELWAIDDSQENLSMPTSDGLIKLNKTSRFN
jgi:hypothetical protein